MIEITDKSRILIINTAFLGDIALTSFLAQKIKNHYNSSISVLTTKLGAEVLSSIKSIDNIYTIDKRGLHKTISSTKELAKKIAEYNFDIVISLHKSHRTSVIVNEFDSSFKIGFSNTKNKRKYNKLIEYKNYLHEAYRYISTIFEDLTLEKVELEIKEDDKIYTENLLLNDYLDKDKKNVVLAPGSVWETKKWGNKKYSDLANILKDKYNVIFIGSESDFFETPVGSINLIGKTSFAQLFHILSISNLLVTNDSAPTHFGSIVDIPTITIYGPTDEIFGFGPLSKLNEIICNPDLKCRPCRIHGSDVCPLGTHECMRSISTIDVEQKVKQMLFRD